jgi:hypothetical protein
MRRGWRLLRQRGLRSRSGQVSAVATVLALLLFVSFLSTFVLEPLNGQMTRLEVQHEIQVENQFSEFQNDVEIEASSPQLPLYLNSPVTLGSLSNPPFGHGSSGSVAPTTVPVGSSVSIPQYSSPKWGSGNLCTATATGCGNSVSNQCTPPLDYNLSANSTTFTFDLTGSSDCVRLNVTGNLDTITLELTGTSLLFVFTLFGFNDTIILNNMFNAGGSHAYFYLYGGYDTYEGVNGPTGSGPGMYLSTSFIGESPTLTSCGIANQSSTDRWSMTGDNSSNAVQNLSWYNSVGYATPYHQTNGWPGQSGPHGDVIGWQNVSTPINCAFYTERPIASAIGGVAAALNNLYSAPASVAFDAGAVVFSAAGVDSVMVSPPPWTFSILNGVTTLSFTLFDFTSAGTSVITGSQTADIQTFLVSESYVSIPTGGTAVVEVTTSYPTAWMNFLSSPALGAIHGSVGCLGSVKNCASPPAGKEVTVTAQFHVSALVFNEALISVSLV